MSTHVRASINKTLTDTDMLTNCTCLLILDCTKLCQIQVVIRDGLLEKYGAEYNKGFE